MKRFWDLHDHGNKTTCLIDSGATLSFMSREHVKERGYTTIKLTKPIHLQLAAANAKAEVLEKTKELKVIGRNGRDAITSFHIIDMADDCVIGQDLFTKLGIFIGGISTKAPLDESVEHTDSLVEIPRLKEKSTKDLISGTENTSELFYLYLNELSFRYEELFQEEIKINESLRGLCTHFIKFASRALQGAEATSYGATKRELLAIVYALKEFRAYLWGRSFILRTDHRALTYLFTQKYPNQMIQAWFELLLDFDFEIQYIPGIKNILPDRLSRLYDLGLRKDRYIFKNVRQIQEGDDRNSLEKSLQLELQSETLESVEDRDKRKLLIQMAHLKGHFGAKAIQLSIQNDGFTWPNIRADAQNGVSSCLPCQRYNIGKHGFHPIKNLKASLPFDHVCIDVKNMVPSNQGNVCYLLVIDVFTRFVFLKALKDQTAISVARALLEIFATVGFPRIVGSDNGSEFVNEIMQELCRVSLIDHRLISAYHHRANGIAERAIRSTSDTIYKMLEGQMDRWDRYLLATQFFHNLKETELTGSTPYSLVFARKANDFEDYSNVQENPLDLMHLRRRLNYMNELVYPSVVEKSAEVHRARNEYFKKRNHIIVDQFAPGAIVMVRDETRNDKNSPRYEGPFTIVRRNKGGVYVLRNNLDEEFVRPPNVLKLVHHDLKVSGLPGIAAEVDKILAHKEVEGETHYLVHWKKLSSTLNQWVPHSEFMDIGPILLYHKCLSDGKDIQKDVSNRKARHREMKKRNGLGESIQQRKFIVENNIGDISEPTLSEQKFIPERLRFNAPGNAMIKKSGSGKRLRPHVHGRFRE